MKHVLFIGNSHLSALKFAYDDWKKASASEFRFFCAKGSDLFFTEISDGKIKPLSNAELSERQLYYFSGMPNYYYATYLHKRQPLADVAAQFIATGGEPEIELAGISAVFHVAGLSPYDFIRLGDGSIRMSRQSRRDLLARILGADFFLHRQISEMRRLYPACRHYLIGRPLLTWKNGANGLFAKDLVLESREVTRAMAREFLFDDVFMPSDDGLTESLLATRIEYTVNGRQVSCIFQEETLDDSDREHMNRLYGRIVIKTFVEPIVSES